MSSGRGQEFAVPDPINVQGALQAGFAGGRDILAFERGEFAPFFNVQEQLGQTLQESLAPLGAIPESLRESFQQNIRAGQSVRGLATSPLGAASEAQQLAGLSIPVFQATTGAAQRFTSGFRPTTGFSPTGTDIFQADLLRQQQEAANKSALFNLREQRKFAERSSKRQTFAQIAGILGGPLAGGLVGAFGELNMPGSGALRAGQAGGIFGGGLSGGGGGGGGGLQNIFSQGGGGQSGLPTGGFGG